MTTRKQHNTLRIAIASLAFSIITGILSFSHASTVPTEAFTKQSIIMNQINILQDNLALTSQIENNKIKSLRPAVKNSIIQNSAIDQAKTVNDTLMDTMTFGKGNGFLTE